MFEFKRFGEALAFVFFVAEADVCVLYGGSRWVNDGQRLVLCTNWVHDINRFRKANKHDLCTNQPEPKQ